MPETSAEKTGASKYNRSRLSNNAQKFLDRADGRTKHGRRYRDIYLDLIAHLGGADNVSVTRHHLVKRTAALITWCECVEDDFISEPRSIEIAGYTTGVNALRRLLVDIGLDPRPRDITPTFDKIFRAVIEAEPEDDDDDDE